MCEEKARCMYCGKCFSWIKFEDHVRVCRTRTLFFNKFSFFDGFIFGILALTCLIVAEYGINFEFLVTVSLFNFRYCFRALTMILLCVGSLGLYRSVANRNALNAIGLTLITFGIFDTVFVAYKMPYYSVYDSYYFLRNTVIFGFGGMVLEHSKKKLNVNLKASAILMAAYIVLLYFVMGDYWNLTGDWYFEQYSSLKFTLEDVYLKIVPFLCFILPRFGYRKAWQTIYDWVDWKQVDVLKKYIPNPVSKLRKKHDPE